MNTTISISMELRDRIKEFGTKGETYEDILYRLCKSARERMLHDLLMNTENCITVEEALEQAEKKWPS